MSCCIVATSQQEPSWFAALICFFLLAVQLLSAVRCITGFRVPVRGDYMGLYGRGYIGTMLAYTIPISFALLLILKYIASASAVVRTTLNHSSIHADCWA